MALPGPRRRPRRRVPVFLPPGGGPDPDARCEPLGRAYAHNLRAGSHLGRLEPKHLRVRDSVDVVAEMALSALHPAERAAAEAEPMELMGPERAAARRRDLARAGRTVGPPPPAPEVPLSDRRPGTYTAGQGEVG
jgi:hypothetical protein